MTQEQKKLENLLLEAIEKIVEKQEPECLEGMAHIPALAHELIELWKIPGSYPEWDFEVDPNAPRLGFGMRRRSKCHDMSDDTSQDSHD